MDLYEWGGCPLQQITFSMTEGYKKGLEKKKITDLIRGHLDLGRCDSIHLKVTGWE